MTSQHFQIVCSCGALLVQCRCPAPDKPIHVKEKACSKCRREVLGLPPWKVKDEDDEGPK